MSDDRRNHSDMAYELGRMKTSKIEWLETFSTGPKKWPDHIIEHKQMELVVLEQAEADYSRAAERQKQGQTR